MSESEVAAFLAERQLARVATLGADGSPHVVPIGHVMLDGKMAFWTEGTTQTAVNIARDPRVAVVVDAGSSYADFRGVAAKGRAHVIDDRDLSRKVAEQFLARVPPAAMESARPALLATADARSVVVIDFDHVSSWDHRKLAHA